MLPEGRNDWYISLSTYYFTKQAFVLTEKSLKLSCTECKIFIYHVSKIPNFSMKYFIFSKVYSVLDGIKKLYHCLSACARDDPLAKVRGLSPRTGGQTMV